MQRVSIRRNAVAGLVTLAALLCLLGVASPAGAADPFGGGIGGYSVGGAPLPAGAPRIPYTNSFLRGSPDVGRLKVRKIRGGARSGRVLVRVRVKYPHLKRQAAHLLSDRATYHGKARITLRRGSSGKRVQVSDRAALPLGTAAQGGRVTQDVVLSRRASKRIASRGGRVKARIRAIASFDQFGEGKAEDRAGARSRRRVAVRRIRGDALKAGEPSPWACAGPGDIPDKGSTPGVHTNYVGGTLRATWATPLQIRLCRASDRRFDPSNWHALPGFDGKFPDSTTHGQLSPLRLKGGYITVNWRPNAGKWQDVSDRFTIAVNGAGEHADQKEVWDFRLAQAPFTMRAMGDSITAGFGYLGDGSAAQYDGNDQHFDAIALYRCAPVEVGKGSTLNNRCSSNSGEGRGDTDENSRWTADTGLANNVSWAAQFANRHNIAANVGGYATYRNWAVTGSEPANWIPKDGNPSFSDQVDAIVRADPQLTVVSIGANPILGKMLMRPPEGLDGRKCGGNEEHGDKRTPIDMVRDAEGCVRKLFDQNDVYRRLRAIYRRLLDAPDNHIVVAPYPTVYPPLPFWVATNPFVNDYRPFVADRLAQLMNNLVRRAVEDEAARARAVGEGNRLFMLSPKKFNIGEKSYDQVINGAPGVPCPTRNVFFNVDGPTNQTYATADVRGDICPATGADAVYTEGLDGAHLNRNGARVYADALDQTVRQIGLPVDGRGDYHAELVSQLGPPALTPGEKGTATLTFRNLGTALSREGPNPTRCRVSRPRDGASEWLDPHASNTVANASGNPIGVKIDQGRVAPGALFSCTFHVVAPNKPYGAYPDYFSPVTEDKAWMLPQDDVSLPFSIADSDHVFFPASSYSAHFVHRQAPAVALAPGETSRVRFTFQNDGQATLYNKGTNPTRCAPSKPLGRQSLWVDKAAPIEQNRVGPGEKFTCTLPVKSPSQIGVYNESFSPVTEGKDWVFNDPVGGPSVRLTSADANHVPWPDTEYGARWIDQSYPQQTLHPGDKGTVKFTFMNTRNATLYNTGTNPTYCRPSHPTGRQSLWVDKPTPIDQARAGPGSLFTCTITVTAPSRAGTYNEYFSVWTKDKGWQFNNGVDDVFVPLKSG